MSPAKNLGRRRRGGPTEVLGVNRNTVLRALRVLRDEGLLEFRRGRGITVAGNPQRGAVVAQARQLVRFAREQGYGNPPDLPRRHARGLRTAKFSGACRDRTGDLRLAKAALSQLS
jgi:DNA-binding transcriptional MocR family regulator